MSNDSTLSEPAAESHRGATGRAVFALMIAWSKDQPWRVGDVTLLPTGTLVTLGRGPGSADAPRLGFGQQRPGQWLPSALLDSRRISRRQLELLALGPGNARVSNCGRCQLYHNGIPVDKAELVPTDTLRIGEQLLLYCVTRPDRLLFSTGLDLTFPFGEDDAFGMVGESALCWQLRAELARVAALPGHVLITGASGSGKELAAHALHRLSGAPGALLARNAATIPSSLIDAELFGNAKNYPNAGMPDRPGLIGAADGSSLFLDEIGDLGLELQAHLLRVLDGGEYQRLGDSSPRRSTFRLLAATNRDTLRPELMARFAHHVSVPNLNERPEDIPLLIRFLTKSNRNTAEGADSAVQRELVEKLLGHTYETHVRELRGLLHAEQHASVLPQGFHALSDKPPTSSGTGTTDGTRGASEPSEPQRAQIQACLDANNGSIERTWRALGLSSRFALNRLIKKHQLEVRRKLTR